jgi:pyruvate dehydrogenase E2 component (dihydrolipoamide acetyltransferase)
MSITPIVMPKWGLSMSEGKVTAWLVNEGATIEVGTPILEVETDKIANAVEAADPGELRRKIAQEGETLPVKALLGVMAPAEVSEDDIDAYVASYVVPAAGESDEEEEPAYAFT